MRKYKHTEFPNLYNAECEAEIASADELSAYIDKELPTWKRYLIKQHLKKCQTCADYVQRLQTTDKFLRQSGEVETSADFLASVMARASEMTQHQRQQESFWSRVARYMVSGLETSPTRWMRHISILADKLRQNIQTRSPIYIFALTFCVFTMVGATLYPPHSDRDVKQRQINVKQRQILSVWAKFGQSAHVWKASDDLHGEKLISFEVIRPEPPKRLLTTTLQQK